MIRLNCLRNIYHHRVSGKLIILLKICSVFLSLLLIILCAVFLSILLRILCRVIPYNTKWRWLFSVLHLSLCTMCFFSTESVNIKMKPLLSIVVII